MASAIKSGNKNATGGAGGNGNSHTPSRYLFWCCYCHKYYPTSNEFATHLNDLGCIKLFLTYCLLPERHCGFCKQKFSEYTEFGFLQHCWICILSRCRIKVRKNETHQQNAAVASMASASQPPQQTSSLHSQTSHLRQSHLQTPCCEHATTSNPMQLNYYSNNKQCWSKSFGESKFHPQQESIPPMNGFQTQRDMSCKNEYDELEVFCMQCKRVYPSKDVYYRLHGNFCPTFTSNI